MELAVDQDGATRASDEAEVIIEQDDKSEGSGRRKSALKQAQESSRAGTASGEKVTIDHTVTDEDIKNANRK